MKRLLRLLGFGQRSAPRPRTTRLELEQLEERAVPALLPGDVNLVPPTLQPTHVETLLARAAVATDSTDAIIAVVDRMGTILGVRVEGGVSAFGGDLDRLHFAIDGAVAKARTAAFFASDAAPLTSRTIQFISQSTITQREVEALPYDQSPASTLRGPGYVAPIGIGGHFPPNIPYTPLVDLFAIEHTNRDSYVQPGIDRIKGTDDDVYLDDFDGNRFSADYDVGQEIRAPLSYREQLNTDPLAPVPSVDFADDDVRKHQSRGIATLPGGIPIYQYGTLIGGIGVFFPGETGFANEENSVLSADHDPTKADRTLEAEFIGLAAVGGATALGLGVGPLGPFALPPGFDLPVGRIDLVGITLDVFGPQGIRGPEILVNYARNTLGIGGDLTGMDVPVDRFGNLYRAGETVPDGYLVSPKAGLDITADEVREIIEQGINEANLVRAQIRLANGDKFSAAGSGEVRSRMVLSVADRTGEVVGLYRMPDATYFSIDVAVAKARNMAYYNDRTQIQDVDQVSNVPDGAAFTNRTFRYLANPRFPVGIEGAPPAPFSILNDPGIDNRTGLNTGAPLPASAYTSVLGFDSFNPSTNFHAQDGGTFLVQHQNGVVFFPGSSGVYRGRQFIGGFGVSGDGVDQDDVVTALGIVGYAAPSDLRADQFIVRGIRLPYLKLPRNARG